MNTVELIFEQEENYFMREAFNTLRTNILFSGRDVKTIVVTSCMAHEGKTTVTYDVARSLAEYGKRVLLIDADLRKSVMVSRYTKERGVVGLSQLLSGQIAMEKAIYHTQMENLDIIFAGPYPPNPTELVGSDVFRELLEQKRAEYDYIFVDAPPLGLVIDAAVMANVCDGAIMVICAGRIKHRLAQDVKDQLVRSGCKILGVVLNQVSRKNNDGTYYGSKYSEAYYADSEAAAQQQSASRPTAPSPRPAAEQRTAAPRRPAPQVRSNPSSEQK